MSEQLIIQEENQSQEDQQYIDEMVAKAEKALEDPNKQQTQESDSPKLYAGKYKTVEEMEKGYLELQKKFSQKRAKQKEEEEQTDQSTSSPEEEAKQALENVGLDFNKYSNEILTDGVLSDESYQELEAKGFPKSVVDAYIEGQKALVEKTNQSIYEVVGGQQAYTEMIQWAAGNLTQEEIEAFNNIVASNDVSQIKMAVRGLKAAYVEAKGNPPKQVLVGGGVSGAVDVYESWAQVTEDMKNPKYEKDPAFRNAVQAKLGRSKNLM